MHRLRAKHKQQSIWHCAKEEKEKQEVHRTDGKAQQVMFGTKKNQTHHSARSDFLSSLQKCFNLRKLAKPKFLILAKSNFFISWMNSIKTMSSLLIHPRSLFCPALFRIFLFSSVSVAPAVQCERPTCVPHVSFPRPQQQHPEPHLMPFAGFLTGKPLQEGFRQPELPEFFKQKLGSFPVCVPACF